MLIFISVAIGTALGATGPLYAGIGWYSIFPWGLAGAAIGAWSAESASRSVIAGAVYGFALCFAFLIAGYTGTASLLSQLPFFAIIGLFGSVCGIASSLAGFAIRRQATRLRSKT